MEENVPLWFQLKPEHIDDNFDRVLDYLQKKSQSTRQDPIRDETLELLSKRVDILLDELSSRDVYDTADVNKMKFAVRLLGVYILFYNKIEESRLRLCNALLLYALSESIDDKKECSCELIQLAFMHLLGKTEQKLPFTLNDIQELQPQVLAYKLVGATKKETVQLPVSVFRGGGVLTAENGTFYLQSDLNSSISVHNFPILDGLICVSSSDKLKQSLFSDIDAIKQFTSSVIDSQGKSFVKNKSKVLKQYLDDDTFEVEITGFTPYRILVESVDPEYEKFRGEADTKTGVMFYTFNDFSCNLKIGGHINVKRTSQSECTISDDFARYVSEQVARVDFGQEVLAVYKGPGGGKGKFSWMTEYGYCVYTSQNGGLDIGKFAIIKVADEYRNKVNGYINGDFIEESDSYFDQSVVVRDFISGFPFSPNVRYDVPILEDTVRLMNHMLMVYEKNSLRPIEKYKTLSVSRMFAELTGNTKESEYLRFLAQYLEALLSFSKGETIAIPAVDSTLSDIPSVSLRRDIVAILNEYGCQEHSDILENFIMESSDPLLVKLATMVQSSNNLSGIVSESLKVTVKHEITKLLSVETENKTDLEEQNTTYVGAESSEKEFKTSFFIPPKDAKEKNQEINVFRVICSFFNTLKGGTIFMGVNDLGYVCGIDNDISYMLKTIQGSYAGVDGYIRYITDRAKNYFSQEVIGHMDMEPMYGGKVLAIKVNPYPFGIVELRGEAYTRISSESVTMSTSNRQELMSMRISFDRKKADIVDTIFGAIKNKQAVIFHGYSSSHSGLASDRKVEPFHIYPGSTHICCYDLDKDVVNIFNVSRIGNVELLDSKWKYESLHVKKKMDIFHMSADVTPYHIELRLDRMAKNLLCEEYRVEDNQLIVDGDKNWILSADVYSLQAAARFYIGLAEHIEILDAPELKEYIKSYITNFPI